MVDRILTSHNPVFLIDCWKMNNFFIRRKFCDQFLVKVLNFFVFEIFWVILWRIFWLYLKVKLILICCKTYQPINYMCMRYGSPKIILKHWFFLFWIKLCRTASVLRQKNRVVQKDSAIRTELFNVLHRKDINTVLRRMRQSWSFGRMLVF